MNPEKDEICNNILMYIAKVQHVVKNHHHHPALLIVHTTKGKELIFDIDKFYLQKGREPIFNHVCRYIIFKNKASKVFFVGKMRVETKDTNETKEMYTVVGETFKHSVGSLYPLIRDKEHQEVNLDMQNGGLVIDDSSVREFFSQLIFLSKGEVPTRFTKILKETYKDYGVRIINKQEPIRNECE